jgi:GlpG protein
MRQIGTLTDERLARRLVGYLLTLGIRSQIETESGAPEPGTVAIWALDEDRIPQAREEFQRFRLDPNDDRYIAAEVQARQLLDESIQRERQRQRNIVSVKGRWNMPSTKGLTFVLIVISCAVGFATDFGEGPAVGQTTWQTLAIDRYVDVNGVPVMKRAFGPQWDVLQGQIWRLVTPIFLHYGPMHLLMNMLGLHTLGKLIEIRFRTWTLAWLVLLIAVVSNLSQYAWSGPNFAGMSGVVLGLFGYVWMKSEFDPQAGFRITRFSILWILFFVAACFTGFFGPIANAAHVSGLATGMVLGFGPVLYRRTFSR